MSISKQIPDAIKRVCRAIGYAAWLDTSENWLGLSVVFRAHLSERQKVGLAFAILRALDHGTACKAAKAVLDDGAGQPIAPLFNHIDEAAFWVDMAEPEALEAYCLASFNAMPTPRKSAFLEFAQGRQVA